MAESKKRYVYQAQFDNHEGDEKATRVLLVVAPHFQRAAHIAVKNTAVAETLVDLHLVEGAVA